MGSVLSTGSQDGAMAEWRDAWVPAVLDALTSANERLQTNVSVYGLPVPLCMDSGSLVVLLQRILSPTFATPAPGASPDGQVKDADSFEKACSCISYLLR